MMGSAGALLTSDVDAPGVDGGSENGMKESTVSSSVGIGAERAGESEENLAAVTVAVTAKTSMIKSVVNMY